jgi:prepilin signal peptidase PulO-like enzyme (type II secretory pathway)
MKYLKTVLLGIIAGALFGALICLIGVFIAWDTNILKEILIPIRISIVLGIVFSTVHYLAKENYL